MVWGKIIGALAGLALGHTLLSMLAGALLGQWLDSWVMARRNRPELRRRNQVFLVSVTCLAAKLAKVDGPVSREEVDCFKALFRFNAAQSSDVARLFDDAKQDPSGFEPYARTLADTFANEPFLLAEIFAAFYRLAAIDGGPNPAEQGFLEAIAAIFSLPVHNFSEAPRPTPRRDDDPYLVLAVPHSASMAEIKAAWRRLSREHHPDNLIAKGVPADYVDLATRKMAEINAAYDQICKERGVS